MTNARIPALLATALLASACVPEDGPLMERGRDCLECHGGGGGDDARAWTVAGTMGGRGAAIAVRDAGGRSFTLRAAENGNFYTAEHVTYPIRVSVDGREMPDPVPSPLSPEGTSVQGLVCVGTRCGCNDCHLPDGSTIAYDEFMLPGRDCLECHRAGGVAAAHPFTAAGTWTGPGITVRVGGVTIPPTNRVGNFFTEAPIRFPTPAEVVGVGTMDDPPADYGGCNRCHPSGADADD